MTKNQDWSFRDTLHSLKVDPLVRSTFSEIYFQRGSATHHWAQKKCFWMFLFTIRVAVRSLRLSFGPVALTFRGEARRDAPGPWKPQFWLKQVSKTRKVRHHSPNIACSMGSWRRSNKISMNVGGLSADRRRLCFTTHSAPRVRFAYAKRRITSYNYVNYNGFCTSGWVPRPKRSEIDRKIYPKQNKTKCGP